MRNPWIPNPRPTLLFFRRRHFYQSFSVPSIFLFQFQIRIMNTSLVILFMGVLLAVLSHYAEARPTSVQKTMSFLRKRMLNTRLTRSAFMSKEEDEEYEEDEEEEEENNNWGSKEDAELFLGIFDLNNDGKIDEPELWAFFEALSYDEVDIKQLVEKVFLMDIDHNAYLSTEELANAMAKGYL